MARGWESKSVESQIADAEPAGERRARLSAAQRELENRRRGFELSRARVRSELEATTAPVRRAALESALAFLDGELAKLGVPEP
jgi:hypothetical protein